MAECAPPPLAVLVAQARRAQERLRGGGDMARRRLAAYVQRALLSVRRPFLACPQCWVSVEDGAVRPSHRSSYRPPYRPHRPLHIAHGIAHRIVHRPSLRPSRRPSCRPSHRHRICLPPFGQGGDALRATTTVGGSVRWRSGSAPRVAGALRWAAQPRPPWPGASLSRRESSSHRTGRSFFAL